MKNNAIKNPRVLLQLEAPGVGTVVQITNLGFTVNLTLPAGQQQQQGVLSTVSSTGDVFTSSIVAPNGERFPFGNLTSVTEVGVGAVVDGSQVQLNLTNVNITMEAPYISDINPALDGLTIYRMLGSLVLTGVAGCDPDTCLPNGRCGVDENGAPSCECSCGWSGPTCNVSSGFCSVYENSIMASSACPQVTADAPLPCVLPSQQDCNPLFEYKDATSGQCECKQGWGGPRCEACETNQACSRAYGGRDAECSDSILYHANTTLKSYTCDLQDTGLESTIVPGSFYVTCNTTMAGPEENIDDGSYCKVNFAMQEFPFNPITCKSSLCSFRANESAANCETTSCSCQYNCPDLEGIFATIENRPAVISCDESRQCTFDIENFFVKLKAPCKTTSCRVNGYNFEDGSFEVRENTWLDPFLASIPLIILVSVSAFLFGCIAHHRTLYFGVSGKESYGSTAAIVDESSDEVHVAKERKLEFRGLSVMVGASKAVLCDVSGEACAGKLTGIMGPSGSGKTTLISCLSQRPMHSTVVMSGTVLFDGCLLEESDAKIIAYCPQDSVLLPTLTVYETILYSAILRLPSKTQVSHILRVSNDSISKMGLDLVKDSYVGGSERIRGISGGERRRVTVAMELVTSPKIVLLDEPTSGLDSSSAKNVMLALKSLSQSGCIVMASLHQPPPTIFNMLDKVMFLAGGMCLYNDTPYQVESFLSSMGYQKPSGDSVAEFMLECASDEAAIATIMSTKRKANDSEANIDIEKQHIGEDAVIQRVPQAPRCPIRTELATLTWRNGLDMVRNPSLIVLHWLLALGMGIFAGCVFYQVGLDTSGAQNRAGGMIFALALFAFTSLTTVDLVYQEKAIVDREVDSGYYRRWTYVISKVVLDGLLLRFIPILLFSAPFYPMMGLESDSASVALFLMTLGTFAVAVGALSLSTTFLCSTPGQANFMMNIILLVCLLNSGFFVNVEEMPDWVSWLRYISFFFYGYTVLITNEASSLLFQFVVEGYTAVENVRGTTFLGILGVNWSSVTHYVIILDCLYAAYVLLALLFSYYPLAYVLSWITGSIGKRIR